MPHLLFAAVRQPARYAAKPKAPFRPLFSGQPPQPVRYEALFSEADHPRADDGKFGKGSGKPAAKEAKKPKGEAAETNKKGTEKPAISADVASLEARKAAFQKALAKAKNAPSPSAEDIEKAKVGIAELGANLYRKKFVGNSTDRAARRKKLQEEFGDGEKCPCVWCGTFVGDAIGEGTLEQDKIFTTGEGGRYKAANLVPSCGGCNKRRSDKTFADFSKEFDHE